MHDIAKAQRKIIHLTYPPEASTRPVVCNLARLFDLTFNILKAHISPRQEGTMIIELSGTVENYLRGIEYLKEQGIKPSPVSQRIFRNDASCIMCGLCTAVCPSKALSVEPGTRRVLFDSELCTACGLCTRVCPVGAMSVDLNNGW
jgi:ferredoxin